jgi:flagellin
VSRINTNINSLIAQRVLTNQQDQLSKSLERLSTGLAINHGSDNPAGLIASEKLKAEQANLTAALGNAQRADQIAGIADGGLAQLSTALTQISSLVSQSASSSNLSQAEKDANQQQVDQLLQTIDRIASTTSFAGTKLLNGNYDFSITGKAATVSDYTVNNAAITQGGTLAVQTVVTASAHHGTLYMSAAVGLLDLSAASARFAFELGGAKGTNSFSFASGTTFANMATTINASKTVTGVSAVASANYLKMMSTDLGSNQFVSVKLTSVSNQAGGVFTASTTNEARQSTASITTYANAFAAATPIKGTGQDVGAMINGIVARGNGRTASVSTNGLDVSMDLTTVGSQTLATIAAFTIQDSGAKFNLGSSVDLNNQYRLGLKNVASRNLGNSTLGYLSQVGSGQTYNLSTGDLNAAQAIVNKAIDQVSTLRGRVGAFQNYTIGATIDSLNVALENTSAAQSAIADTNFAAETANMTRNQILVQAGTSVLAMANTTPQTVLSLLGK